MSKALIKFRTIIAADFRPWIIREELQALAKTDFKHLVKTNKRIVSNLDLNVMTI